MNKKISLVLSVISTCLIVLGCGSKENKKETYEKEISIVLPGANSNDTIDPISGIKSLGSKRFEELIESKLDGVKVNIVGVPWAGWIQSTETNIMSGNADIAYYSNQVMAPDWFIDHTKYLEDDSKINLNNLSKVYLDWVVHYMSYKSFNRPEATNKIYGLPTAVGSNIMVYDKKIFDDWGIEYPSENASYEELLEKASKMTGTNPVTGDKNYGGYINPYWMEWHSIGFDAVKPIQSDDMILKNLNFDKYIEYIKDSPNVLNFFKTMEEIVKFSPPGITTETGAEKFFTKNNDIAITFDPLLGPQLMLYEYGQKDEITERFKPIMIPISKEGKQGFPEVWRAAITKNAKDKDLAWEVTKLLSLDKDIVNFYATNYASDKVPALKDTNGMKIMDYPLNKKRYEYTLESVFVTDDYWYWRTPLQTVNSKVIAGEFTPEEARKEFYQGVKNWTENTIKQLNQ